MAMPTPTLEHKQRNQGKTASSLTPVSHRHGLSWPRLTYADNCMTHMMMLKGSRAASTMVSMVLQGHLRPRSPRAAVSVSMITLGGDENFGHEAGQRVCMLARYVVPDPPFSLVPFDMTRVSREAIVGDKPKSYQRVIPSGR